MISKNFIVLTENHCLGIGYAKTFWIEVKGRLGQETRLTLTFQKHISCNERLLALGVKKLVLKSRSLHEYIRYLNNRLTIW